MKDHVTLQTRRQRSSFALAILAAAFAMMFEASAVDTDPLTSCNRETVLRHFRWMREYGIDGAFVQRFANGVRPGSGRHHKDVVLANCRAYAVMYDLSGLSAGGVAGVVDDWKMLRAKMCIGEDAAYLRHRGNP